jgi:hypothetical protein
MIGLFSFRFLELAWTWRLWGALLIGSILSFGVPLKAWASEVDPFTDRARVRFDLTDRLNAYVRTRLEIAVGDSNAFSHCDSGLLYTNLRELLVSNPISEIELMILADHDTYPSVATEFDRSIFGGFGFLESPGMHLTSLTMANLIRLNGQVVGTDKLGHFFGQGWDIFSIADLDERGLVAGLRAARVDEDGKYGLGVNGVRSFADLAANYRGYEFWKNLTQYDSAHHRPALLRCQSEGWRIVRAFDWRDYVDLAWDDGNNCFDARTPQMARTIQARLQALSRARGEPVRCPLQADACAQMRSLYGTVAEHVIHPSCLR